MALEVISRFGTPALVAAPTFGQRKFGVPPRGPFDTVSSRLANALLDNTDWAPVLELTGVVFELLAHDDTWLAVVGCGADLFLNENQIRFNSRVFVPRGATLRVKPNRDGLRSYLALPGGVDWTDPAKIGGLVSRQYGSSSRLDKDPFTFPIETIEFLGSIFLEGAKVTVTPNLDRVGLRLDSNLQAGSPSSGMSQPSVFGAIQLTPDGQLLIHGPDGPTIAGYEILGVVTTRDRQKLAQLRPGDAFKFRQTEVDVARQAHLESERDLSHWIRAIRSTI